ncbi:DUF1203 domain-containing protein [Roseiterribacter gracilis]|uniref:DUF1203 domain-containing protein n=1 Tax=Roseiterribacter gracilis TaxID=2812848 RepID=A0A8S8XCA2_9PROT|nr:hypothetical protein TMPK1_10830 [Rhodospirillales bacterium TMPK1]
MSFRVTGLSLDHFRPLFALDDATLASRGIQRLRAEPGWPDRIGLQDARGGESYLLLPFEHQPEHSPYRSAGPIFVDEHASETAIYVDEIPDQLRNRLLSVRAYDEKHEIVDAEVLEGVTLVATLPRFFDKPEVAYLHVHNARRGCYAARIDRL